MSVSVDVFNMAWKQHGEDDRKLMHELLEQVCNAEEYDYEAFWVAEHHFELPEVPFYGALSAPAIFLAHAAAYTRRIGLGTAVWLPTLDHPLHVSEQAAVLDLVSQGRFFMGIGQGSPHNMEGYNIAVNNKRGRFRESIEVMLGLFQEENFSYQGNIYQVPKHLTLVPRLYRDPDKMLWIAARDEGSLRFAAEEGMGILIGQAEPTEKQKKYAENYLRSISETTTPYSPEICLARLIYVAETDEVAYREVAQALENYYFWYTEPSSFYYYENVQEGFIQPVDVSAISDSVVRGKAMAKICNYIVGSPETVKGRLRDDYAQIPYTRLLVMFHVPGISHEQVLQQMRFFSAEVLADVLKFDSLP